MASVLKFDGVTNRSGTPMPIAFNIEDVQTRARKYLSEIQLEADAIIKNAKQEAELIRLEATQQGIAKAEADIQNRIETESQKLSDQRCRTAIASCEASVTELTTETSKWLAIWRDQTIELASKIAEKLLRRQTGDDNELLRVWLEEALVAMRDSRDVRIFVHPDDFAVAGRFLQNLAKSVPHAVSAEVVPDPEIQLGGCIVRSDHGQIDQQLATQLQRLVEQLT